MKILFVLPQIYPYYTGGAEIFHYHLLVQLSKEYKVGYIGFDDVKIENINFHKINKVKPWRIFTQLQIIIRLVMHKSEYDIIHMAYCQGSWVHWFYYPILKRIFKIKYGFTIHDPSLYKWKTKRIFEKLFNHANFIVAVSERLKEGYELRCKQNIKYLPPLIPLHHYLEDKSKLLNDFGYNLNDKIFLFAGSLKISKRPLVIIDAILDIGKDYFIKNNIKFIFVGTGIQVEEIQKKISDNNLNNIVKLAGRIKQENINLYYKLSSYYIIPSEHEGKSMSLIEAMFNKLPIIASDAPGINDIIKNEINGLLFELDNPKELGLQIIKIIEDKDLSDRISTQAYSNYLTQFQYLNMYNAYIELYKKSIY